MITGRVGESKGGGKIPGKWSIVVSLPGRVGWRQNEDWGRFRAGSRLGESMNPAEVVLIALLVLSLVTQVLLARSIVSIVRQGVDHLDNSLASALESTLSNLPESLGSLADLAPEPVNPLQALVMEMIQARIKPPTLEVKEISRSDDGKFS